MPMAGKLKNYAVIRAESCSDVDLDLDYLKGYIVVEK